MNQSRNIKKFYVVFFLLFFIFQVSTVFTQKKVLRSDYLKYVKSAVNHVWNDYDKIIVNWEKKIDPESIWGYRPPGNLMEMAVIFSWLAKEEGNKEYIARAKKIILEFGDYRKRYPKYAADRRADYQAGVPALPDFFTVMRYIKAFHYLNQVNGLTKKEVKKVENLIAHSIEYLLRTAEWGPMNRTALRAESFSWAVKAIKKHPRRHIWEMQRKALGDDNWGNWEIEDATIYHAVWLYAMLGYADSLENLPELMKTPEMYYYSQYFLNLVSPYGLIPDFGDANWNANWARYLVYFETAAASYNNPYLKWVATGIARKFIDFTKPVSVGRAYYLLDCYRWGSDKVDPIRPKTLSREVMEDVQGKKIVFRNGWKPDSTYLLLNYRDEGDGGLNFRDYLRDTIPVEEEKMTHGHADENSIVMLMSGKSLLLHDGGYRDYMPSGPYGSYRQDYFHNRLVVRPEKIWMGQEKGGTRYSVRKKIKAQPLLDFLHNAGSYRKIRTQKVDFITLPDFDYSRTRLIDKDMGYEWDRVVTWVKNPGVFVVFDIFKSRVEEYFTLANLWHTRKILAQGKHWYDTVYDRIGKEELPDDKRLLIHFPSTHFRMEGVEKERRHYQEELLIHQTTAQHFELAEHVGFITILYPHDKSINPENLVKNISLLKTDAENDGLAVKIRFQGKEIMVGVKCDLRQDMTRDWRRPRYTYDAGRIGYGKLQTNGDFVFTSLHKGKLNYTVVNLTKAVYGNKVLFSMKPSNYGLAFDNSPDDEGVGKVRYWRDSLELKK